jgi:hypothetical protein
MGDNSNLLRRRDYGVGRGEFKGKRAAGGEPSKRTSPRVRRAFVTDLRVRGVVNAAW